MADNIRSANDDYSNAGQSTYYGVAVPNQQEVV